MLIGVIFEALFCKVWEGYEDIDNNIFSIYRIVYMICLLEKLRGNLFCGLQTVLFQTSDGFSGEAEWKWDIHRINEKKTRQSDRGGGQWKVSLQMQKGSKKSFAKYRQYIIYN